MGRDEILALKRKKEAQALQMEGIEGVGRGRAEDGTYFLTVYTNRATPHTRRAVRALFDGAPIRFEETGPIRAQAAEAAQPAKAAQVEAEPAARRTTTPRRGKSQSRLRQLEE
jgi:hypothetical protein